MFSVVTVDDFDDRFPRTKQIWFLWVLIWNPAVLDCRSPAARGRVSASGMGRVGTRSASD